MKIIAWLDRHFEEVFLFLLSAITVAVVFLQVFMRYVMGSSLSWSEELARYSSIWLIYIGISYGVKKNRHIKVDAFVSLIKDKRGKLVISIISNLLFLVFAIFVVFRGYIVFKKLLEFGQTSPALQIPMAFVYLAAPFGMGLTVIRLVQNIIGQFKTLLGTGDLTVKIDSETLRKV